MLQLNQYNSLRVGCLRNQTFHGPCVLSYPDFRPASQLRLFLGMETPEF